MFHFQEETEVVTISGYHDVPQNNEQSLLKALANQPLSVAIEASGRDFQFYSGVYIYLITHKLFVIMANMVNFYKRNYFY